MKKIFLTILFFHFFSLLVLANEELKREYFIKNDVVMLSDIIQNPKEDFLLYQIPKSRHTKRVKASKLIKKLQAVGYKNFQTKHAYIQFTQKSPLNLQAFKKELQKYYQKHYKEINILHAELSPNHYIISLPKEYTIHFGRNAYLSKKGVFYIKTNKNKKIFFHYTLHATLSLYETKKEIQKGEELSFINCKKRSIMLDKFRAMPLLELPRGQYEAKHRIKKSKLLTERDVTGLYLIKRGSPVTITLQDGGVSITFSARALQNGRYGDTIAIRKHNNKKIYVTVTGKNRAKVK